MIQHFTPDNIRQQNEQRSYEVFVDLVEPFKQAIKDFYSNAYISVDLGRVIYEGGFSPISDIWNDPKIRKIYHFWHNCYENVQSAYYIIEFLRFLYTNAGINLNITKPLAIGFDITVVEEVDCWWNRDSRYNLPLMGTDPQFPDAKDYELFVRDSDNDENTTGLLLTLIPINISQDGIYKVIKDITYPGLYFNPRILKP